MRKMPASEHVSQAVDDLSIAMEIRKSHGTKSTTQAEFSQVQALFVGEDIHRKMTPPAGNLVQAIGPCSAS
jgi:hypothetical protein